MNIFVLTIRILCLMQVLKFNYEINFKITVYNCLAKIWWTMKFCKQNIKLKIWLWRNVQRVLSTKNKENEYFISKAYSFDMLEATIYSKRYHKCFLFFMIDYVYFLTLMRNRTDINNTKEFVKWMILHNSTCFNENDTFGHTFLLNALVTFSCVDIDFAY